MRMETLLPTCPHCGSCQRQSKYGRTRAGSLRYWCHTCQRPYTPVAKQPGYSPQIRQQAIKMYVEGLNFRRIGRLLGVHHQSVINWVNAYQAKLKQQTSSLPRPEQIETVEMDELYPFIGEKKTTSTS